MPTTNGVIWQDYHEGYREQFDPDRHEVIQFQQLNGAAGYPTEAQVRNYIVGTMGDVQDVAGKLSRTPPVANVRYPWLNAVSCDLAKTDGAPRYAADGVVIYPQMVYRVVYRQLPFRTTFDANGRTGDPWTPFMSRKYDYAHEALQVRSPSIRFANAAFGLIFTPTSLILPISNVTITWHWVIPTFEYERERIQATIGAINSAQFDAYQPKTLLFMGAKKGPVRFTFSTEPVVDYEFQFLYRLSEWNRTYFPGTSSFELVVNSVGPRAGLGPYREVNFNLMLGQGVPGPGGSWVTGQRLT